MEIIIGECWSVTSKYGVDLYSLLQNRYAEPVKGEDGEYTLEELITLDIYSVYIPQDKKMCADYYCNNYIDCFLFNF